MTIIFKYYRRRYGDWNFVKVDAAKGLLLAVGNSASTDVDQSADLSVFVESNKELEWIKEKF